jgi:hypothetical protein
MHAASPRQGRKYIIHDTASQSREDDDPKRDEAGIVPAQAIVTCVGVVVGQLDELAGVAPKAREHQVGEAEEEEEVYGETWKVLAVFFMGGHSLAEGCIRMGHTDLVLNNPFAYLSDWALLNLLCFPAAKWHLSMCACGIWARLGHLHARVDGIMYFPLCMLLEKVLLL